MIRRSLFTYILLLVSWQCVLSQEAIPVQKIEDINTSITCMLQDENGVLWMGTYYGIISYDGQTVKAYKPNLKDRWAINGRKIFDLIEDKFGKIWIASQDNGLLFLEKRTGHFGSFSDLNAKGINFSGIKSLYIDHENQLWVGAFGGAYCISGLDGTEMKVEHLQQTKGTNITDFAATSSEGFFWMSSNKGLFYVENKGGETHVCHVQDTTETATFIFNVEVSEEDIFIAHRTGIKKYSIPTEKELSQKEAYLTSPLLKIQNQDRYHAQNHIWKLQNSDVLYGLKNGRLVRITGNGSFPVLFEKDIDVVPQAKAVLGSKDGTVWIGGNYGLWKIPVRPPLFSTHTDQIRAVVGKKRFDVSSVINIDSLVLIGSRTQGLISAKINTDGKLSNFSRFSTGSVLMDNRLKRIKSLYVDSKKRIWIATRGNGVFIADFRNRKKTAFSSLGEQLSGFDPTLLLYAYSFAEMPDKSMLIGTYKDGLFHINVEGKVIGHYQHFALSGKSGKQAPISSVLPETNTTIWVGTQGKGLFKFDLTQKKVIEHFRREKNSDSNSVSDNFVLDLTFDNLGGMWVATENGLDLFDRRNRSFINLSEEDGLPNNCVHGLLEDGKSNLWMATIDGLAKIELEKAGNKHDFAASVQTFHSGNGLPSDYFMMNATSLVNDRLLLFGTDRDLVSYSERKSEKHFSFNKLYLKDVFIDQFLIKPLDTINGRVVLQEKIDFQKEITLKPFEQNLTVEFGVVSFTPNEPTKYAYRMKGFHDEWYYTDYKSPKATYTNLPAGEFTFELKATRSDGSWMNEPYQMQVKKGLPFWKTKFAFLIYALAVGALYFLAMQIVKFRYRVLTQVKIETNKREQLEESFQDKLRFFTNISHELKSPLTLILGPIKNLIGEVKELSHREQLEVAYRNANRLHELVLQILEFRKAEVNKLRLHISRNDADDFVNKIYQDFLYLSRSKQINFTLEKDELNGVFWFDQDKVKKVLFNLLSNALKYTPAEGTVNLKSCAEEGTKEGTSLLKFEVHNTGSTIPKAKLSQVFERFYQLNSDHGGFGIGLALSKKLVETHKGEIKVESEDGKGTSFSFWIPVDEDSYSLNEKEHAEQVTDNIQMPEINTVAVPKENNEETSASLPVLLVVEDNPEINNYIKSLFFELFQVRQAFDGKQGAEMIAKQAPDIIISDLMMPQLDGIELVKRLKKKAETENIPIVLLTANEDQEKEKAGLEQGVSLYIKKPFDPDLFRIQIANLYEQTQKLKQHIQTELATETKVKVPKKDSFEVKLMKFIERNIDSEDFSVDILAERMNMSRAQLYRKTKETFGISPVEVIRKTRVKHSAKLIQTMTVNISEAAYRSGFSDLKYFRESFKKEFGVTPSEYRKRFR